MERKPVITHSEVEHMYTGTCTRFMHAGQCVLQRARTHLEPRHVARDAKHAGNAHDTQHAEERRARVDRAGAGTRSISGGRICRAVDEENVKRQNRDDVHHIGKVGAKRPRVEPRRPKTQRVLDGKVRDAENFNGRPQRVILGQRGLSFEYERNNRYEDEGDGYNREYARLFKWKTEKK
jgi:hypothetical protein